MRSGSAIDVHDEKVASERAQGASGTKATAAESSVPPQQQSELVQRILASAVFRKSRRLSDFLAFVCNRYQAGELTQIQEQRIGVEVFGRSEGYHVGEDSIVRSQARFLRQRLEEYFLHEGRDEAILLTIPKGSYIPQFSQRVLATDEIAAPEPSIPTANVSEKLTTRKQWLWPVVGVGVVILCVALFFVVKEYAANRPNAAAERIDEKFWSVVFDPSREQMIVPGDSSLVLMEEISGKDVNLADYIDQSYLSKLDPHKDGVAWKLISANFYTSLADLDMVYRLQNIPGLQHSKVYLRSARDLSLTELKEGNALLIGGPRANPWVQLFENNATFHVKYDAPTRLNVVFNSKVMPGEQAKYSDDITNVDHVAYGVISFLPSLDGRGSVLLIRGTKQAGTQAAGDFLFTKEFSELLQRVSYRGGFHHFEVLLTTGETHGDAHHTKVVSLHVMD